ncbi:MAG: hypothetical protein ACK5P7_10625 [Bdellovibrio sp.]
MRKNWIFLSLPAVIVVLLIGGLVAPSLAEARQPIVGRKAASKYFENDREKIRGPAQTNNEGGGGSAGDRGGGVSEQLLMLSLGSFIGSNAYVWGPTSEENGGRMSYGVTYLYDEWAGLDMNIRADFNEYRVEGQHAKKLSLLPLITFPRAAARFPLYFGLGAGLGVFFQQIPDESNLSFDYQLVAGARFMDLFENFGFFFELGMKNHLHLLSDGQVNGNTMTAGGVFSF